eukprot:6210322-Pleurochrysis_carterae.AAC.4
MTKPKTSNILYSQDDFDSKLKQKLPSLPCSGYVCCKSLAAVKRWTRRNQVYTKDKSGQKEQDMKKRREEK